MENSYGLPPTKLKKICWKTFPKPMPLGDCLFFVVLIPLWVQVEDHKRRSRNFWSAGIFDRFLEAEGYLFHMGLSLKRMNPRHPNIP